jgi:hypothetical protein
MMTLTCAELEVEPTAGEESRTPVVTCVDTAINATRELAYWRENYRTRPYAEESIGFEEYEPAYRYGLASCAKYPGCRFGDIEPELSRDWNVSRGSSTLPWDRARCAVYDAWDRFRTSH